MIPPTMKAWESSVEKQHRLGGVSDRRHVAHRAVLGAGDAAMASPTIDPSLEQSEAEVPGLTPYEMRRFLQHAQRYFVSVRREPFGMPQQTIDGQPLAELGRRARPSTALSARSRLDATKCGSGDSSSPISVKVSVKPGAASDMHRLGSAHASMQQPERA